MRSAGGVKRTRDRRRRRRDCAQGDLRSAIARVARAFRRRERFSKVFQKERRARGAVDSDGGKRRGASGTAERTDAGGGDVIRESASEYGGERCTRCRYRWRGRRRRIRRILYVIANFGLHRRAVRRVVEVRPGFGKASGHLLQRPSHRGVALLG